MLNQLSISRFDSLVEKPEQYNHSMSSFSGVENIEYIHNYLNSSIVKTEENKNTEQLSYDFVGVAG